MIRIMKIVLISIIIFCTLIFHVCSQKSIQPKQDIILFESSIDGNNEIFLIRADGTSPVNLSDNPAYDGMPSWTSNGSQIFFVSDRDSGREQFELFIMDSDGSNLEKIEAPGIPNLYPTFQPLEK